MYYLETYPLFGKLRCRWCQGCDVGMLIRNLKWWDDRANAFAWHQPCTFTHAPTHSYTYLLLNLQGLCRLLPAAKLQIHRS